MREIKDLEDYQPRYDPTVIPMGSSQQFGLNNVNTNFPTRSVNNTHPGVIDFHKAFKSGQTTPSAVARTVVDLVEASEEHGKAFLSIKKPELLAAAAESTKRYKDGRPLSLLDGVPVGIKDEVDLEGHNKSLATSKSAPCPTSGTSWCVKKWQEAGAIIIGKLNMHELGLGKFQQTGR